MPTVRGSWRRVERAPNAAPLLVRTCPPPTLPTGCAFSVPARFAAPFAKYNADGTGRDTYIRRDPVECFGKNLYRKDPPVITRMGAAGSAIPRERPRKVRQEDPVGGVNGGMGFERPARFLRPKPEDYPIEIGKYSTMKEIVQDAHISSQHMPGHLNHISSYAGFQPRYPTAEVGSASWAEVSHAFTVVPPAEPPAEPAAEPAAEAPAEPAPEE